MQFKTKSKFFGFVLFLLVHILEAGSQSSFNLSSGYLMIPSARFEKEGTVKFAYSKFSPINKINLVATPYDWLEASVYYNDINVRRYYPGSKQSYKDKGFSFKLKLKDEDNLPAVAIGFEDIAGTSIFKSEYIVATQSLGEIEYSVGIGFGALGSRDNVNNFLRSGERSSWDFSTGGEVNYKDFFKGKAAIFGGLSYKPKILGGLEFLYEYDTDDYSQYYDLVPGYQRYKPRSSSNIGLKIPIKENFSLSLAYIKGNELAVSFEAKINIAKVKNDNVDFVSSKRKNTEVTILNDLRMHGIFIQNIDINHVNQEISLSYAQSSFHDQKLLAKKIKDYLRTFHVPRSYKIKISVINGAFELYSLNYFSFSDAARITQFQEDKYAFNPKIVFPIINYSLGPNFTSHIGSPSGFFFGGIEGIFSGEIAFTKNIQLNTSYSFPIYDNYNELDYDSNPTNLYQVRTNVQEYLKYGKTGFNEFTINYYFNQGSQNFFQASIGHFEKMYSGIHFEFLKRPFNNIFSYGLELSKVYQRDFTKSFTKFQDYKINIGHLNLYAYEPKNKMLFHLSVGKYLAGDKGFTFDASRYFNNGARIGFFFSRTNISAESFGEGSFDKGVYIKYPLHIFNKNQSSRSFSQYLYRPIQRDGAAKLEFSRRLFDLTLDAQLVEILSK